MKELSPLTTVLLALLIIAVKVTHDWYRIEKLKKGIHHGLELAIVLIAYGVLGWLSGGFRLPYYGFTIACFFFSSYFALHDPLLNKMRGKPMFYLGTNRVDRWLVNTPHPQLRVFSLLCFIGIAFVLLKYGK